MAWGAEFDLQADGTPALAIEGAHSARRVLHARDATGREMGRTLWRRASTLPGVTVEPHARVVELLIEGGRCVGAHYVTADGELAEARADAVLLATGGAGQIYRETTNPAVATGDGIAMAYRAGAAVADLEFVQFHPTALKVAGQPRFLLSEALRGEGAQLVNADGEAFVARYESAGDLASRDRVSRAIAREEGRTGQPVYLSLAGLDPAYRARALSRSSRTPAGARASTWRATRSRSVRRRTTSWAASSPISHGRTTLPGLFAAGEVACTGVHGANRLASNSLLEGLVFGARAGRRHAARAGGSAVRRRRSADSSSWTALARPRWRAVRRSFRRWRPSATRCGARSVSSGRATRSMPPWNRSKGPGAPPRRTCARAARFDADGWRTMNLLTVALLVARAARRRQESRGAHYRDDYPARDDIHWQKRIAERHPSRAGADGIEDVE